MTTNDIENINANLTHVIDMGNNIIELYQNFTYTELVAQMMAMFAAVNHVAVSIRNVSTYIKQNVLDPFKINYLDSAHNIEYLNNTWNDYFKDNIILPQKQNFYEIVINEDTNYDLNLRTPEDYTIKNASDDDDEAKVNDKIITFNDIRVTLMERANLMSEAIDNGLKKISKTLRDINKEYENIKKDSQQQENCIKCLERNYESGNWKNDRMRFIERVNDYTLHKDKNKETYQNFLTKWDYEATDPYGNKTLTMLNECFLNNENLAKIIIENRDKFSFDDIAQHFLYIKGRKMLLQHIDSFELREPANEEYKDLFVNKAAQKLAFILANTIGMYVDFKHNYQYAALQMAMQDLKLIYKDKNNGKQMMKFINNTFLANDEKISDQSTLTKCTGKLLGSSFGMMDENNLKGNFTLDDFNKLKNNYWLCLSIINNILQYDLKEMNFASYLYENHENTPNITDYIICDGEKVRDSIQTIKSVIRGKSMFN